MIAGVSIMAVMPEDRPKAARVVESQFLVAVELHDEVVVFFEFHVMCADADAS